MTIATPTQPAPFASPRKTAWVVVDVILSIVLLYVGFIVMMTSAVIWMYTSIAIADVCSSGRACSPSVDDAVAMMKCAPVILLAGAAWTVVRLSRRRLGWWTAALTAVLSAMGWGGFVLLQATPVP